MISKLPPDILQTIYFTLPHYERYKLFIVAHPSKCPDFWNIVNNRTIEFKTAENNLKKYKFVDCIKVNSQLNACKHLFNYKFKYISCIFFNEPQIPLTPMPLSQNQEYTPKLFIIPSCIAFIAPSQILEKFIFLDAVVISITDYSFTHAVFKKPQNIKSLRIYMVTSNNITIDLNKFPNLEEFSISNKTQNVHSINIIYKNSKPLKKVSIINIDLLKINLNTKYLYAANTNLRFIGTQFCETFEFVNVKNSFPF